MKKILATVLVVVLTFALCVGVSAKTSLDRLTINNNTLATMPDDATNLRNTEEDIHINKGDKLFILGWAYGDEGANLKEVVYTLDGKEYKCDDNYRDRADVAEYFGVDASLGTHAGVGKDDNAFELKGIDALDDGTYTLQIIAKFEDGTEEILNDVVDEFTLVVGTGEASTPSADAPVLHGRSFDAFVTNYVDINTGDFTIVDLGPVNGSDGSVNNIGYYGWLGFEEAIDSFGYQINNNDPVFDSAFAFTTEDAVKLAENGGQYGQRFLIVVPTAELKGTNTIKAVVKLASGTVVALDGATIGKDLPNTIVEYTGPAAHETVPQTGDFSVAMFAVIAVLAMGAAVVFMKKKAF